MHRVPRARSGGAKEYMTTAIASSGGRCRSVVLTERYARPPRVARTHHRRSHSKLSETQFREGFSAPRYPPNVPPDHPTLDLRPERGSPPPHPTLDLGRQRRWGGGDYGTLGGGTLGDWAIRAEKRRASRGDGGRCLFEPGCGCCTLPGFQWCPLTHSLSEGPTQ
jgi:hypothetical protein